jgi:hypothetical protein
VSVTATIKTALVADLDAIDGTGIFSTTLKETGTEPVRIDEAEAPAIYIFASDGTSDLETLTNLRGETEQSYTLDLVIKSTTPNADMDTLLDDVRNAIERSTSNVLGVAAVNTATVTDWTPVETDPGIHEGVYIRQVNVVVSYLYTRGSA